MPYLPRSVVVIRNLAIKGIKPDGKLAKSADEKNRFVMHFSLNDPIVNEDKLQAEEDAKKLAANAPLNLDQKVEDLRDTIAEFLLDKLTEQEILDYHENEPISEIPDWKRQMKQLIKECLAPPMIKTDLEADDIFVSKKSDVDAFVRPPVSISTRDG